MSNISFKLASLIFSLSMIPSLGFIGFSSASTTPVSSVKIEKSRSKRSIDSEQTSGFIGVGRERSVLGEMHGESTQIIEISYGSEGSESSVVVISGDLGPITTRVESEDRVVEPIYRDTQLQEIEEELEAAERRKKSESIFQHQILSRPKRCSIKSEDDQYLCSESSTETLTQSLKRTQDSESVAKQKSTASWPGFWNFLVSFFKALGSTSGYVNGWG